MWQETEEAKMLRDSVRRTVAPFDHQYFLKVSGGDGNPTQLWGALGDAGFLGVNVPVEFGGGGQGIHALTIVTEEVAANGCPLMLLALSPAVCATILSHHGSPDQQQEWLPRLASGGSVMAFAITEPEAGSNAHAMTTTARRDGSDWVLAGTKYYVSHVDNADAMLVVARTGSDPKTQRGLLTLFIVPTDAPGLQRSKIDVEILSPERQFTVFLDDVRLPSDAVVGTVDDGLRAVFAGLNPERLGSAAVVNGISRYARDRATRYARERSVWSTPIGAHQAIAHPLARAHVQVELARLATHRAALDFDAGLDTHGARANIAKYAAAEAAAAMLDAAIQTHGGNGMATEYGLSTLWGLVRLFRIAPVSSEMVLNHVAHHELGLPKSY